MSGRLSEYFGEARTSWRFHVRNPIFYFGATLIGLIWIIALLQFQAQRQRDREELIGYVANLTLTFERNIARTVGEFDTLLKFLRTAHDLSPSSTSWSEIISGDYLANPRAAQIGVIDKHGVLVTSTRLRHPPKRVDLGDREHFLVHRNGRADRLFISKPVLGRVSRRWSVQFTRPVHDASRSFGGVIVASLDQAILTDQYKELQLGPNGGLALVGSDGILRAGNGIFAGLLGTKYSLQPAGTTILANMLGSEIRSVDGTGGYLARRDVDGHPLQVIVVTDGNTLGRSWIENTLGYFALAWICTIVVLLICHAALRAQWREQLSSRERNALEVEKRVAEAASEARRMFLAVMSHEIRTPLNGLLGALDLIYSGTLDDRTRHQVEVASRSGESLLILLDEILTESRLEAGKVEFARERFDLVELLRSVDQAIQPLASRGGNQLATFTLCEPYPADDFRTRPDAGIGDVDPEDRRPWPATLAAPLAMLYVVGDANRLRQVIVNLVGNAMKFTHNGRIALCAGIASRTVDSVVVRISVSDTGIGIPKDKQKIIFDRFETLDPSFARMAGGTGLGLSICERIVKAMGSDIKLVSDLGKGSCFYFDVAFPLAAEKHDETASAVSPVVPVAPAGPLRILLAEDNPTNAYILTQYLTEAGHQVAHASSGRQAIDFARRDGFDVVLMDISMPDLDGIESARTIRAECPLNAATAIIAVTAHADVADREKFLAAGMNDCLTKPVRRATLLAALANLDPGIHPGRAPSARPLIDDALFREFADDRPTSQVADVLAIFVGELRIKIGRLEGLVEAQDGSGLRDLGHAVAGSAAMLGAARLEAAGRRIEAEHDDSRPFDAAKAATLMAALRDTIAAFEALHRDGRTGQFRRGAGAAA